MNDEYKMNRKEISLVTFFYLILSIVTWGIPIHFDFLSTLHIDLDPSFSLWALKWWPYAISHGLNPFVTDKWWAPFGVNLTWTTSSPSIALLTWPVTFTLSPIASWHFITVLSLTFSSSGVYLLVRELGVKKSFSIFSSLIFFFSPYVWGQLMGHLFLSTIFPVPLLIYITILKLKGKIGQKLYLFLTTLLLSLQFGIFIEIFATLIFFSFIVLTLSYFLFPEYRKTLKNLGLSILISIFITAVLWSPYLYYMLTDFNSARHHHTSYLWFIREHSIDPLNLIIPSKLNLLLGSLFKNISANFTSNPSEQGGYLGIPIVLIIFWAYIELTRKNRIFKILLLSFGVILILSMGPSLNILHKSYFPLPQVIIANIPLIKRALPARFTLYSSLLASIIVALWLEKSAANRYLKYLMALLSVLFLLPDLRWYKGIKIEYPDFIKKGLYKKEIPEGANIILFPTRSLSLKKGYIPALWQQETNFYFRFSHGMGAGIPYELSSDMSVNVVLNDLFVKKDFAEPKSSIHYIYSLYSFISKCNVTHILVPDDFESREVDLIISMLSDVTEHKSVGGVSIYCIDPERFSKKYIEIKENYKKWKMGYIEVPFEGNFSDEEMMRLIEYGACNPEKWGVWSCEKELKLKFFADIKMDSKLKVILRFYTLTNGKYTQKVEIIVNKNLLLSKEYTSFGPHSEEFIFYQERGKPSEIIIKVPNSISPKELGINQDGRKLGIGLISFKLTPYL